MKPITMEELQDTKTYRLQVVKSSLRLIRAIPMNNERPEVLIMLCDTSKKRYGELSTMALIQPEVKMLYPMGDIEQCFVMHPSGNMDELIKKIDSVIPYSHRGRSRYPASVDHLSSVKYWSVPNIFPVPSHNKLQDRIRECLPDLLRECQDLPERLRKEDNEFRREWGQEEPTMVYSSSGDVLAVVYISLTEVTVSCVTEWSPNSGMEIEEYCLEYGIDKDTHNLRLRRL